MAQVLLITHVSPPAIDGGSRVIVKVGEYLQKIGHHTMLISSNAYSTDDFTHPHTKHTHIGIPYYTIFHKPLKLISKIFPIFGVFAKGPIFKYIPLIKIIKFKPDLIIAGPLPTTIILYAYLIKKVTGAKLLINASFHPTDSDFHNLLLTNTLKSADYIWTLTDYETKYFAIQKTIQLGNGIDPALLIKKNKIFPKTPTLLFIGSLSKHKNIENLINIHQKLLPKFPTLKLVIAGQQTLYYPKLKPLLSLPNIETVFSFKDEDLKKLIDNSTILVSPSSQESFGLTLIEAWARKTPVVGINIPASVELISKSNGGLIGLDKIEKLLNNQILCQKLGQNGYNYVKAFYLWPNIVNKICQKLL